MAFDYSKLWKILEERKMYKKDLRIEERISSATLAKLSKNQIVSIDVRGRICEVLVYNVGDIVSHV
ncbi:helix-turn-helix domain-containing protein [Facklamia sp. P13069]|uniref:helix-turn-helix domain-containing protein n=1 Tax=Facklamia sp. P13069 TaxID=3421954 RepID=UPI003D17ECCD